MADIDHFKAVNDQNGHLVGDALLMKVAAAVEEALREGGIDGFVGRYGGEEFGIILPDSALEEALPVGEAVRRTVASSRWQIRRGSCALLKAAISVGVAEHQPGDTAAARCRRRLRHIAGEPTARSPKRTPARDCKATAGSASRTVMPPQDEPPSSCARDGHLCLEGL
jgi:GGDEF domain-containing protein